MSPYHPWLSAGIAAVLLYRAVMASLLEAFHALTSLQRRRLLEEEAIQDPLLARLLERPHALGLGITLLNQLLLVILLSLLWPMREAVPGRGWTLLGCTLIYVWTMDLALPTLLTSGQPARWIVWFFPFYAPAHRILAPLVAPLAKYVARKMEAQEKARDEDDEGTTDDAVTALLEEGEAEGILEEEDRELIRNVVGFGDTVVREVMTPRTSIQGVPVTSSLEDAWATFRSSRHSRLPVYGGTVDHIVGVLLLKDLMQHQGEAEGGILDLVKPTLFIPESNHTLDLLRELQRARTQMAVVVDEFGSVSGIVTLEDLLEEVFGEIREEHELHPEIQMISEGEYLVSGQVHVEDLDARLGMAWAREGFDTVGGLVMAQLGRVPKPQELVEIQGASLVVQKMEGPRVIQVLVKLTP